MATFAQFKDNIAAELGLDETASGDEDTILGRRLNQAVREVLLRTHCRIAVATTSLTANEDDYELPTDLLAVHKILNSDSAPLEPVTVAAIHEYRRAVASSPPPYSYRYAIDANLLLLYPSPSAAGTLTFYYVPKPTEMSSGSHDPGTATYGGIPTEFQPAVEAYAMWRMSLYDGASPPKSPREYRDLYGEELVRIRQALNRRSRARPRARVGGRRWVSNDPSRT